MAPVITYKRIWCKKCNEFELHKESWDIDKTKYICKECGTLYSDIFLDEIPKEKLLIQRKRYTEWVREKNANAMKSFLHAGLSGFNRYNQIADLFREDWDQPEIVEGDAGQKRIDDAIAEEKRQERELQRIEREKQKAIAKEYSKLNRNDFCLCGKLDDNGKPLKYKKCCLTKIQSYE